jgi:hypothetical protein
MTRSLSLVVLLLTFLCLGCSSGLSRTQALQIIQDELSHEEVRVVRVTTADVDALIDAGVLAVGDQPCPFYAPGQCFNLTLGPKGSTFSNLEEKSYYPTLRGRSLAAMGSTPNNAILHLATPIQPSDVQVTGIAAAEGSPTAAVEFSFSYRLPAVLARLPNSDLPVQIWDRGRAGQPVVGVRTHRWIFQKYDDRWRVAQKDN